MTEAGLIWGIIGLIAGIAGAVMARRFYGPRRARNAPPRPPASRQERRKRERETDKRGR